MQRLKSKNIVSMADWLATRAETALREKNDMGSAIRLLSLAIERYGLSETRDSYRRMDHCQDILTELKREADTPAMNSRATLITGAHSGSVVRSLLIPDYVSSGHGNLGDIRKDGGIKPKELWRSLRRTMLRVSYAITDYVDKLLGT